ncbi:MAG: type 1 glutamine amidotransferase [Alphaproteobacteria bacterium]|nr:type 1 glutamine amidotransferase [Alphaproteobacteria bacterium]
MRFALLQARQAGDPVRDDERAAFAARLEVPVEAVRPHDLLTTPARFDEVTRGVDAVLVGGSGAYSIFDDEPWIAPFVDTLGELAARDVPTFASCFGFQGLVVALGGVVARDEARSEVGTFPVTCTDAAATDPLFGALPTTFLAQLGHKDRATVFPDGAVSLARSERCPYQALRVGEVVYATQFHPELTCKDNLTRLVAYADHYRKAMGEAAYHAVLDTSRPSPEAASLLLRFRQLLEGRPTA